MRAINTQQMLTDEKKHWYVIYTKPRWEKKVFSLLTARGIEAYCPLNKVLRKWSDRLKAVEQPLFTSYVFVCVLPDDQLKVRMVNGVVNFVYWQGKPAVVRDQEIDVIRKFLNEYDDVSVERYQLAPDMIVRIQRGLFMDKEATILKVEGNKVKVNIESIGYTLVATVNISNVEATAVPGKRRLSKKE